MVSILEWEDLLPSWWQGAICLTISQIVREYSRDSYIYTEAGSKNKQGTFTERHISNKIVIIYICSLMQRQKRDVMCVY